MITNVTQAHNAYAQTLQNTTGLSGDDGAADSIDFGSVLKSAVSSAIDTGHAAEAKAAGGITKGGDMTQIVTAVSNAQLALQTTTVVRDRMVQSYQDIMKMSI